MKNICLYFQLHQPVRLRRYRFFDIGADHYYYDDYANESNINRLAHKCYLPANKLLTELMKKYDGRFNVAFSISGTMIDQLKIYAPEVIGSFREMASTGCVEFVAETSAHSLASLRNLDEFKRQVAEQVKNIEDTFGQTPVVFRNTELIYSDQIGEYVAQMGFKAMLSEGAKQTLGWKSPNYLYCNDIEPQLKVLVRNYHMSDDIALRFSNSRWSEWPLTADKFKQWTDGLNSSEEILNLFLNYEAFGASHPAESGIMDFLRALPATYLSDPKFAFITPSKAASKLQPVSAINVPSATSWVDEERDLTAWLGNEMQNEALDKLYDLAPRMARCSDEALFKDWQYLQTSDHFYYMGTKFFANGSECSYSSPYATPYEAFINYMNILTDFSARLRQAVPDEGDAIVNGLRQENNRLQNEVSELEKKLVRVGVGSPTKNTTRKTATRKITAKTVQTPTKKSTKTVAEPKETKARNRKTKKNDD